MAKFGAFGHCPHCKQGEMSLEFEVSALDRWRKEVRLDLLSLNRLKEI